MKPSGANKIESNVSEGDGGGTSSLWWLHARGGERDTLGFCVSDRESRLLSGKLLGCGLLLWGTALEEHASHLCITS